AAGGGGPDVAGDQRERIQVRRVHQHRRTHVNAQLKVRRDEQVVGQRDDAGLGIAGDVQELPAGGVVDSRVVRQRDVGDVPTADARVHRLDVNLIGAVQLKDVVAHHEVMDAVNQIELLGDPVVLDHHVGHVLREIGVIIRPEAHDAVQDVSGDVNVAAAAEVHGAFHRLAGVLRVQRLGEIVAGDLDRVDRLVIPADDVLAGGVNDSVAVD